MYVRTSVALEDFCWSTNTVGRNRKRNPTSVPQEVFDREAMHPSPGVLLNMTNKQSNGYANSRGPETGHPLLLLGPVFEPDCCRKGSSMHSSSETVDFAVLLPSADADPDGGGVAASSGASVASVFSSQQLRDVVARFLSGSEGGQPNLLPWAGRGGLASAELAVSTVNGEGAEPDLGNASFAPPELPVKSRRRLKLGPPPAVISRTVFGKEAASVFPVLPVESCLGETYGNSFWRSVDNANTGIGRDFLGSALVVGVATPAKLKLCPPSVLPDIFLNFTFCLALSRPLGGVGFGEKADPETLMPLAADLHLLVAVSRGFVSCLLAVPPVPDSDRRREESTSTAAIKDYSGVER